MFQPLSWGGYLHHQDNLKPLFVIASSRFKILWVVIHGVTFLYLKTLQTSLRADFELTSHCLLPCGSQVSVFLKEASLWPLFSESNLGDKLHLLEIVTSHHVVTLNTVDSWLTLLSRRYSSFNKLQRVVAHIMHCINKCRKITTESGSLTNTDLAMSLHFLHRHSQQESFSEEYNLLIANKPLPSKNKLLSLSPFLDKSCNLIRVGGRLNNSKVKHPILISCSHIICLLIFNMFHSRLLLSYRR